MNIKKAIPPYRLTAIHLPFHKGGSDGGRQNGFL